jgi:multiple sugar transport system ATP-binding protein
VCLKNVHKVYPGGISAVNNFNLEIRDGELVVLVGPSRCGKSTILRMVAGLEEITGGEVSIGNRTMNNVSPKDRNIAMVFQDYALYPHMTARENIAFALKLQKLPKQEIDGRVKSVAVTLGITDILDRRPAALSGGQRQRVALGRAVVRQPALFLFDEPLSNLDPRMRAQMRIEICRLHMELRATMLYVTHDQVEAMTMGERVCVIDGGVIQQVDDPIQLYERPANRFVAEFIGTPPMNFLDGQIRTQAGAVMFEGQGDITFAVPAKNHHALAAYANQSMTLGLRPEAIQLAGGQWSDLPRLRAVVDLIEHLGPESHIYLRAGPLTLASRANSHRGLGVGETVELAVLLDQAHFFDRRTGLRVV